MHWFHRTRVLLPFNNIINPNISNVTNMHVVKSLGVPTTTSKHTHKQLHITSWLRNQQNYPKPLRKLKEKSQIDKAQDFVDIKYVRTMGGKGGDGAISLLQLWVNDRAGPDGGDGGNGGHVIFEVSDNVTDLKHVDRVLNGTDGEDGRSKSCFGKSADHTIVNVPKGTIIRDMDGKIIADLNEKGTMFVAARGGAGGHGNAFFKSDINQTPKISEFGANGEVVEYVLEIRSMAHIGLIGFPNAGKSTLLRAISRARPKVAPYPFTTLKPHLGMILYDDYEQIAVADLPGLIPNAHKNEGLGIAFLKHAERCAALLFVLDVSVDTPWDDFNTLRFEISQFNENLSKRPLLIVANKMDLPSAADHLEVLKQKVNVPILPVSAKTGKNLSPLLIEIRRLYDDMNRTRQENTFA